jgi:hypothetical protein
LKTSTLRPLKFIIAANRTNNIVDNILQMKSDAWAENSQGLLFAALSHRKPVRHFFGQVSWNCFSAGPSPKLFVNPKNHRKEDIIQIGHATKHSYM